ncbi:MAG: hypothetical protein NTW29_03120 [Bacteroidetes bacterium]|nr:hypothetical protein [Bacteroidota bacterium]
MAASVYKWFLAPFLGMALMAGKPAPKHPFHVSVIEINHNVSEKSLEISCKIFTDDFEKTLARNYNAKVDLINPPNKAAMDSLVKKYIFSHLSLKVNGRPVTLSYVGFENENEAAYGYVEVSNVPSVSNLTVTTNIMYDQFDDQMNIMHITVGGNRKSTKLNYPEKEASFGF